MPTEPLTKQQMLNEIAALLGRAKERPCPNTIPIVAGGLKAQCVGGTFHLEGHPDRVDTLCHGTGTITDPRYQAAWEILWPLASHLIVGGVSSSYTKHPVMGWPDCAVVGLLEGVVRKIHSPKLYAYLVNWRCGDYPISEEWATKWFMESILPFHWPDPDDAQGLAEALMEWLEKEVLGEQVHH